MPTKREQIESLQVMLAAYDRYIAAADELNTLLQDPRNAQWLPHLDGILTLPLVPPEVPEEVPADEPETN